MNKKNILNWRIVTIVVIVTGCIASCNKPFYDHKMPRMYFNKNDAYIKKDTLINYYIFYKDTSICRIKYSNIYRYRMHNVYDSLCKSSGIIIRPEFDGMGWYDVRFYNSDSTEYDNHTFVTAFGKNVISWYEKVYKNDTVKVDELYFYSYKLKQ